ncbi:MAG: hypothetical protein ACI8V0_001416 [Pseudohongiellaceae bacterium]|jgi:hypothetical protein
MSVPVAAVRRLNFSVGEVEMGEELAVNEGPIALRLGWQSEEILKPIVIPRGTAQSK